MSDFAAQIHYLTVLFRTIFVVGFLLGRAPQSDVENKTDTSPDTFVFSLKVRVCVCVSVCRCVCVCV